MNTLRRLHAMGFYWRFLLVVGLLAAKIAPASAEASGPDYFKVVGVPASDQLNIRTEAGAEHTKIGTIPPGANGIRNLGCTGGLNFAEWEAASESERAAANKRRWCKIEYSGVVGWVAGHYLAEGTALLGSHWQIATVFGVPALDEAELGFHGDGRFFATVGCNRIQGAATVKGNDLKPSGPVASTRMACVDATVAAQEAALLQLFEKSMEFFYDPISDEMTIYDSGHTPVLRLKRKDLQ